MLRVSTFVCTVWLALFACAGPSIAESSKSDILRSLNFQRGPVITLGSNTLGSNLATVTLKEDFYFLNSKDTQTFLTSIWGNPPEVGAKALGMLVPARIDPLSAEGWGVILSYQATGYVSDEDAEKIDYADLLKEMQEAVRESSKERVAKGYETYELIGWARQPFYDKAAKKLYWAKQLRFGQAKVDTLNYDIRVLGRKGVLSLNVVADLKQLAQIDRIAPDLLAMVSFSLGNLYAEFNPSVDQVAAYGLAGLIAGGVLTKAGFFKVLLAALFAFKKLAFVGALALLAGLWAGVRALVRRRSA
jgi:uncharacterized membrane-anchored protein